MSGPISALLSQTAPTGTWGAILPQGISLAQSVRDSEVATLASISQQIAALQAQIASLQAQAATHTQTRDDAQSAVDSMTQTLNLLQNS